MRVSFNYLQYVFVGLVDDFSTDSDLHMACMILQKQIERIDGKKENIVIPSVRMKKIRDDAERQRAGMFIRMIRTDVDH